MKTLRNHIMLSLLLVILAPLVSSAQTQEVENPPVPKTIKESDHKKPSKGAKVKVLQKGINKDSTESKEITVKKDSAKFGRDTKESVKKFQKKKKLDEDGIIGPKTIDKTANKKRNDSIQKNKHN
jgi:murein L,D-transpeptidase YcbB/YkuD